MFDLDLSLGEKVIRAVVIYLFLVIALRLVGKRELTQLNTLDFVVLLAVANAVQNGLIGADNSVTGAVAGATVLFLMASGLGWLLYRSAWLRRALEGTPTVLIRDGEVLDDALRDEEMTRDDLLVEIQAAGGSTVDDVRTRSEERRVGKECCALCRSRWSALHLLDRKSTRLNSSHCALSRMPSSA